MAGRIASVDDLKVALRIPAAETALDVELGAIVDQISEEAEWNLDRTLKKTAYTDETHPGSCNAVVLDNCPVDLTQTFAVRDFDGVQVWAVSNIDYYIDADDGIVSLLSGAKFFNQPNAVRIDYTAGYDETGSGTAIKLSVPKGLALQSMNLMAATYKERRGAMTAKELNDVRETTESVWMQYARLGK